MTGRPPETLVDPAAELALAAEALRRFDRYLARAVAPDDFETRTARLVVETCSAVWETGEPVNVTSVALALQRSEQIAVVNGTRGLADIAANSDVPDHERIRTLARLRRLVAAGNEVTKAARAGDISRAVSALHEAEKTALGGDVGTVKSAREVALAVREGMRDPSKAAVRRVHPGLEVLRVAVGDLPIGSCTVIGADSNVGKSSVALEMILGAAERGIGAGLISVEDPDEITGSRLLGAYSGVSSRKIQRGTIEPHDEQALAAAMHRITALGDKVLLADCTGGTELDVCAAMSQMATRGARLLVVDYLTEIEASKRQQDRRNEIRWIAKRLKAHAKRCGVALVIVSQLSRPDDKSANRRPTKHSIKESGDVTNSAEVIVLLWREEESDDADVHVWVAKCKWGGVGQTWSMRRGEDGRLRTSTQIGMIVRKSKLRLVE